MKQLYTLLLFFPILFLVSEQISAQQYTISGGIGTPYQESPSASSGIEKLYFLNTLTDATLTYSSDAASVLFYKYSHSLSDAVLIQNSDITTTTSGGITTYTVHFLEDSKGYFASVNGNHQSAAWIIDYTQHYPVLNSISTEESEDKCEYIKLLIDKSDKLLYYTVGGAPIEVGRQYTISYPNMQWDDDQKKYITTTTKLQKEFGTEEIISAPLLNTQFTLSGDQYASLIGLSERSIVSDPYTAIASVPRIDTTVVSSYATSNLSDGAEGIPAPAEITFMGRANEPVTRYYTWYIYNVNDLINHIARYTDQDIKYNFTQQGKYRVVLETASDGSACVSRDSVEFTIQDWYMDAPNFFSPDDSPGVNDEFKVAYRSITKFKCTIFNRWGNKIFEWRDPSKGWDGKYGGKYVNTGVYFYVIEFEASDGQKHTKSGDINILRKK
ncbi:MAG: gliding motility-associated C-terminal domain-containing protein [Dysgonomonas sp.]